MVFDAYLVHKLLHFTPVSGPCIFLNERVSHKSRTEKLSLHCPRTGLLAATFTYRAASLYERIARPIHRPLAFGQTKNRMGITLFRKEKGSYKR